MDIKTTEQIACMGFDAFRILQGMAPKTYSAAEICAALQPSAPAVKHEASELEAAMQSAWVKASKLAVGGMSAPPSPKFVEWFTAGWNAKPPIAVQGSIGDDASALRYAQELAAAIWQKHYSKEAPQWKVLPDLYGALSQIDNMTTGMSRSPVSAAPSARDAALELAYGLLWHINDDPDQPIETRIHNMSAGHVAFLARDAMRQVLTHGERGAGIKAARAAPDRAPSTDSAADAPPYERRKFER